ncbi:helix-turn-helix domain-containing protein [Dokdonella sp.]|uniref:helix-turn-helix domain-containing protein n=1 Tax=Dokdonella sp. TaxID=2291710 RepID=UPI003528FADB
MSSTRPTGRLPAFDPEAGDGDELNFCSTCAFGEVCLPGGFDKPALKDLHCLVEHVGPYRAGDSIFRVSEPFESIFAVRAGTVKTCTVDEEGREQVLGFHLPGEMVGLNAIHPARYPCDAIALDTVYLCRFSFPALAMLATRLPGIQQQLFRLLSADIGKAALLASDYSANERMAAFLILLADRYAARGFSATRFRLSMARGDIANHLRLAAETVSRVLRRFQDQGLIKVEERDVELLDSPQLRKMARCILHG